MIDTIKIHINNNQLPNDFFEVSAFRFKNNTTTRRNDTGEIWGTFNYHNFICYHNSYGVSIMGSVPRFFYGTNQYTITKDDFINAIKQLSKELGVDLNKCSVTRLDLAENIITKEPVNNYYSYLGETKHLDRTKLSNGVEFKNVNRVMLFYDKSKYLRKKQSPIIPIFRGKNILRPEYRLMNGDTVARALKVHLPKVRDVIDRFDQLGQLWVDAFKRIFKHHDIKVFEPGAFLGNQFEKQLMLSGINALGGGQHVLELIKEARKMKLFKYNNRSTNLTRKIKTILQAPILTRKSTLVEELNQKVEIAAFVALSSNTD